MIFFWENIFLSENFLGEIFFLIFFFNFFFFNATYDLKMTVIHFVTCDTSNFWVNFHNSDFFCSSFTLWSAPDKKH